jgi:hypothetical protein
MRTPNAKFRLLLYFLNISHGHTAILWPLGSHISDSTHILVVGQDYLKITYQELDKHQVS